ncbi:GPP34 family phosphoprotein [Streptomyces sp. CB00455]|uniref:GPP34 family phosphoprotein n=1 Tax=Streptomyces sp. CB00455 TaxID=1703927 RepID=UPI000938BA70|nr:GPP34 family phosphoprotein [Streptomyces sp. CB00455]
MTSTPLLFALCATARGPFPPRRRETETGLGLVGALLLQGALAGRLELSRDRVLVLRGEGTGDAVLDEALQRMGAAARERAPAAWVERLGPWALERLRTGLDGRPAAGALLPDQAWRLVREAVEHPARLGVPAVAAAELLTAAGLARIGWPEMSAASAGRRTARAVAGLGPAGEPVARISATVSETLSSARAALTFSG